MSSTHATGTVSLPAAGLTGKLEVFHAKPNKFLQRMSLPGIGDIEEGFDGKVGWSLSPMTGPTLLEGKQLEERAFDADFYEELKAAERYSSMTTVERTTFEGRPVYKVRLVKKTGGEDIEFYDIETGLKAGGMVRRANRRWARCRARPSCQRLQEVRQSAAADDDEGERRWACRW